MRSRLILSGLVGASTLLLAQDVKYNYDPSVNFGKYHPNQLIDRQIKEDIDGVLAAKGLTKVNSNPDVQVGYQIAVDREKQWNAWGSGGFRWGGGFGTAAQSTISIGQLGVDLFDPASKDIVWRGPADKNLDPSGNAQKNMERMQKGIDKLLKNFPGRK